MGRRTPLAGNAGRGEIAREGDAPAAVDWRRRHAGSGVTSGLILAYVERTAGRDGVRELLERAGLPAGEDELRNENTWFSFEEKIRLWRAAEDVLGDPAVARHVGEAVLNFRVGVALKRTLRALGTPDLVYRNVVRANSKFNWAHSLEVVGRGPGRAKLSYHDISGVGYHHYDCDYTTGLLSAVPQLFGLPPARVMHTVCGTRGASSCEFDISWTDRSRAFERTAALVGAASAATVAAGALADPILIPFGAGAGVLTGATVVLRVISGMRRRLAALETRIRDTDLATDAQLRSLAVLSSELHLDRVLEHVTASASTAIAGARFALLVATPEGMAAAQSSDLPDDALRRLERWADASRDALREGPVVLDSLDAVEELRPLAADPDLPLGSACAAPLAFRDELLGVLLALAPGATVFLQGDVRSLEIYAGHAAIALWNARLVSRLEREAAEDPLTGLANRRAFDLACVKERERVAREDGCVGLVVLDLDRFKAINDTFGHPFGDEVLVQVARLLQRVVRGLDTVGRIGGEEFALLLPGLEAAAAYSVAERARAAVATVSTPAGPVSASAGVAVVAGPEALTADPLVVADRALYCAKREGRARTVMAGADATTA